LFENISGTKDASIMIETLKKVLKPVFNINGDEVNISCSIGIAIFPDDGITTDSLLIASDAAMYLKKHNKK
jgi:GGDEF domain-containing protein